jgi:hypothetical protein
MGVQECKNQYFKFIQQEVVNEIDPREGTLLCAYRGVHSPTTLVWGCLGHVLLAPRGEGDMVVEEADEELPEPEDPGPLSTLMGFVA